MAIVLTRQTTAAGVTNLNRPLTNAEGDANFINLNTDKVETSVAINTTAPLTGGGTLASSRTFSLAAAYGDTLNPYAIKTANSFLAAPNGASGVPVFRVMTAADVPVLNQNTTGNAGTVTNGVYTTGNQTIGDVKTFTSQIVASGGVQGNVTGNVTGSAGSVAWTNVSGRPTAVSSFTNDMGYINTGDVARTIVKFASTAVGTRRGLNFLAGSGISLSLADDPGNEEVDITITSMAPAMTTGYPTIRPSLMLDFANTRTLDPRITFTRASEGRFYDGRTVAKAEENLLTFSQEFDQAVWVKTSGSVTANSGAAPDGTSTADNFTTSGANGTLLQSFTALAAAYTASIWVRRVTGTGTVELTVDGTTWSAIVISGTWTRFSTTLTPSAGARTMGIRLVTSGDAVEVWGAQVEMRSSVTAYTPTTTQPITNYIPALRTAAAGVPRFEHNPVTGESLGLLVEEQRANLFPRSTEFDHTSWAKVRTGIIANQIVAPDGTLSADKLVANTDNSSHMLTRGFSSTSGTYTASIYVKAAEYFVFSWEITDNVTGNIALVVNLQSRTATTNQGGSWTGVTGSLTPAGNGWFRASISGVQGGGTSITCILLPRNAAGNINFVGDNLSGIHIWGAQIENGAFPTSYIPTVASQVTRSADDAAMTGANFSSWYRADEGTLYGDARIYAATAAGPVLFGISDGTTANAFYGGQTAPSQVRPLAVRANSAEQALSFVSLTVPVNYSYKFAGAYQTNSIGGAVNGTVVAEDTNALVPQVNQAAIGGLTSSIQRFSGHIRKLAYYPARLSNAQLQALTT